MPRIIDQFGRKRFQNKRKNVEYEVLKEFFQNHFVVNEQSAVEHSFSTYVCYTPDGLFRLNLYLITRILQVTMLWANFGRIYYRTYLLQGFDNNIDHLLL